MCEQTERIGIPLEIDAVCPLGWREQRAQLHAGSLAEKSGDCFFSAMTKRRIAQIMSQTSRGCDVAYVVKHIEPRLSFVSLTQKVGRLVGHGSAH